MPVIILTVAAFAMLGMQLAMGRHPAYAGVIPLTIAFSLHVLFSM